MAINYTWRSARSWSPSMGLNPPIEIFTLVLKKKSHLFSVVYSTCKIASKTRLCSVQVFLSFSPFRPCSVTPLRLLLFQNVAEQD